MTILLFRSETSEPSREISTSHKSAGELAKGLELFSRLLGSVLTSL